MWEIARELTEPLPLMALAMIVQQIINFAVLVIVIRRLSPVPVTINVQPQLGYSTAPLSSPFS